MDARGRSEDGGVIAIIITHRFGAVLSAPIRNTGRRCRGRQGPAASVKALPGRPLVEMCLYYRPNNEGLRRRGQGEDIHELGKALVLPYRDVISSFINFLYVKMNFDDLQLRLKRDSCEGRLTR